MVRQIVTDQILLAKKAELATKEDLSIVQDLQDTLRANRERCVGMAANMIGFPKRIIIVSMGPFDIPMINPKIVKRSKESYDTIEGCLSHLGERPVHRYQEIEVEYQDQEFQRHRQSYQGYVAQIIQHELDHCEGILV